MTLPASSSRGIPTPPIPRGSSDPISKNAETVDTPIAKLQGESVSFADVLRAAEVTKIATANRSPALDVSAITNQADAPAPSASMFNEDGFFQVLGLAQQQTLPPSAGTESNEMSKKDVLSSQIRGQIERPQADISSTRLIGDRLESNFEPGKPTSHRNHPNGRAEPSRMHANGILHSGAAAAPSAERVTTREQEETAAVSQSTKRSSRPQSQASSAIRIALSAAGTAAEFVGRIDRITKSEEGRLRNALGAILASHGLGLKALVLNGKAAVKSILGDR